MSTTASPPPGYTQFQHLLEQHSIEASPAEAQGVIAAVLCLPQVDQVDWLALFLSAEPASPSAPNAELSEALLKLYQATREQLLEDDFEFSLFLPDEAGLAERTAAVAAWCRGFLLGISAGDLTATNSSDLLREILSDLVDISSIEPEHDGTEEDERALVEIEEYVKTAAQLVREELAFTGDTPVDS